MPFEYLQPVAAKYGTNEMQISPDNVHRIAALTAEDLAELSSAYREIDSRGDVSALSEYVLAPRCPESRRPLFLLMVVFKELGRLGIEPFSSGRVRLVDPDPQLNWGKLPDELRYLATPAEMYGKYQFAEQVDEFLRSMTLEQARELRMLSLRVNNNWAELNRFLDAYSMSEHKEAALVLLSVPAP